MSLKVNLHIQSATGNTRLLGERLKLEVVRAFEGIVGAEGTLGVGGAKDLVSIEDSELDIVGVPVYAGRVPNLMVPWLMELEGKGKKALAIVTYGGRHYDDALIELVDLLQSRGFDVVGAGAFVAPHSFDENLIKSRPNAEDWQGVAQFADALAGRLRRLEIGIGAGTGAGLGVGLDLALMGMGQRPYRPYLVPTDENGEPISFRTIMPHVNEKTCTQCGLCVEKCQLGSIPAHAPHTTRGKCTKCNACVKGCPEGARSFVDSGYLHHLKELKVSCDEGALNVWTLGLEIEAIGNLQDRRAIATYKDFVKGLYKGDLHFRDYITPVISEIFARQSTFSKNCRTWGFWVRDLGSAALGLAAMAPGKPQILGAVTFLVHRDYPGVLQVVFMEFCDRPDVAMAIFALAQGQAKGEGLLRVTFGLAGHVNYGLGLSVTSSHVATFGAPYTKTYYVKYLDHYFKTQGQIEKKGLTSYRYPWSDSGFPIPDRQMQRLERHSGGKLTWRAARVHRFAFNKEDMAIYTALNNACFTRHDFYFKRHEAEDLELFKDLRHFMVPGSLIFAYYGDQPVGFLLWYPDWSEWMAPGETLGVATYLKCLGKNGFQKPKTFKIVEWAVVPEHAKKGIPLVLLKACETLIKPYHFKKMVTSWILDENKNSNTFTRHWAQASEHYGAYSLNLQPRTDHENL